PPQPSGGGASGRILRHVRPPERAAAPLFFEETLVNSIPRLFLSATVPSVVLAGLASAQTFVNWENPHVHPLDMTPDGTRPLAVNAADDRLEVFDTTGSSLVHLYDVPVGLDPVSVRARTNDEVWVVNHISDDASVVKLSTRNVIATVKTDDEPADVVFAGS